MCKDVGKDEPMQPWLGRSLALPKVLSGLGFANMFKAPAEPACFDAKFMDNYLTLPPMDWENF